MKTEKSMLNKPGPATLGMVLDEFPNVNGAAGLKAAVLNHLSILG